MEEWPLVGRLEESAFITDALGRSGSRGVVIAGAAGVGKSRLAREALDEVHRRGGVTRCAVATRAAASIPFGALAHMLPAADHPRAASPLLLMRDLIDALLAICSDGDLVLGVDDAHLLDDASATLVGQLVATNKCRVVLTMRAGEHEPDAIASLWKDRLVEYLELQPLSISETEDLLCAALGGDLEGATRLRLFEVSGGNPLFLRELVADGVETGRLEDSGGLWRWVGTIETGPRLRQIVASRLGRLSIDERRLLELVAVGEPLEVGLLDRLAPLELVAGLERRGLLEVIIGERRSHLRLAHPLFGDVLRAEAPVIGTRVACGTLAEAIGCLGARRREDRLRAAVWALAAGAATSTEVLTRGAHAALEVFDVALAERLARAALDAGAGIEATNLLGRALTNAGRFDEAEELFASVEADPRSDEERLALATARVTNLLWGLGCPDEAVNVALRAEAEIELEELRYEVCAFRAQVLWVAGRPREGWRVLSEIPSAARSGRVGLFVALNAIGMLGLLGRCDEASELADHWYDVALVLEAEHPYEFGPVYPSSTVQSERVLALWLAGQLDEAQAISEFEYRVALDRQNEAVNALWAMILGAVWLMRGRPRTALRWLRESAGAFRVCDPTGHFPWCLAFLAQAAAALGDAGAAQAAIDEADSVRRPGIRIFEPSLHCARAWTAAVRGERQVAHDWARHAAEESGRTGQAAFEVLALSDLTLFGDPEVAAERLEDLVASVDGPLVAACALHARATARTDGDALDRAAFELDRLGAKFLAAHAATAAASAHRAADRRSTANASAARARGLLDQCEGARLLIGATTDDAGQLTVREHEIATLAAQGLSNSTIAARLVLSVRTVENHLQHAYVKLGITDRRQLTAVLGAIGFDNGSGDPVRA